MINRTIIDLMPGFMHKQRAIIIYGARRTGKTTILKALAQALEGVLYVNCDFIDGQEILNFRNQEDLKLTFAGYKYLLVDEAQRVADIGIKLKAIIDTLTDLQVIATGSSSLDLSNFTSEPLTGRKFEFLVTPLSSAELYDYEGINAVKSGLRRRLVYGNYPEVYLEESRPEEIIKEIASSYLFKDILAYQDIKRPEMLKKLLIALALQVGNEVSLPELSSTLGMDKKTVDKYIGLLEQCFIIYRLSSYSRNLRTELKRGVKVFFWDNGIRNALINDFHQLDKRTDTGALWENYVITERRKYMLNKRANFEHYFWRTTAQQEIDLIETENEVLRAWEIKWNAKKNHKIPGSFSRSYPDVQTGVVTPDNYLKYVR